MGLATIRRYALRGLVVLFCLAALVDVRPIARAGEELPVAVIDVSASMGEAAPALPGGVKARSAWILVADGWEEVVGGVQAARLPRGASRLGAALRHVEARYPGSDVVLVTDGRATGHDVIHAARRLAAAGGRVFTAPPAAASADVGLDGARLLSATPRARVEAVISSSTSGRAEVRLARGGHVVDRIEVDLAPGLIQSVELEDSAPPPAGTTYQVLLVPAEGTPDDDRADNRLSVGLRPERRVVLACGLPEAEIWSTGKDLVVRVARDLDAAALAGADCVVLANMPWRDIGNDLVRALERFVAGGGRLLLLGGQDAYAGGGWAGTPLEERLSPLRVPREEGTGLALVLAIDQSGSTAGSTLAHLKDAARRALQGIVPGERMAVLPFAGKPAPRLLGAGAGTTGVVAWRDDAVRAAVLDALDALTARGDTDLPAAIREAARRAHGIEARERRVLLLTDGDPDNPPDVQALRKAATFLAERDVRFGALVVGDDEAVTRLRTHLASSAADVQALGDASELSAHLLHRLGTLRANDAMRLGRPRRLVGLEGIPPPFDLSASGFSGLHRLETAVEHGAVTLVHAHYDAPERLRTPLAAVRAVGAGEVAALAWGTDVEARPRRAPAVGRLRGWVAALASEADRGLAAAFDGADLVVQWPAARGLGTIQAVTSSGSSALMEVESGLFRGPPPPGAAEGVRVQRGGADGATRPLRLPSRPEAEHMGSGVDEAMLQAIAEAGDGRRLMPGTAPPPSQERSRLPLAPWLLLAACILLVLDRFWAKPDGHASDR